MTNTVPAGAHDPARPPASQEGLEALLEILPHRHKPGLRAALSGPDPSGRTTDTSSSDRNSWLPRSA